MTVINGYMTRSAMTTKMLSDMRWQLDDLQRQLATGKRSETYSGLGLGRSLDIQARMQLGRVESFHTAISTVDLRVNLMNSLLERVRELGNDIRAEMRFPVSYDLVTSDKTNAQLSAALRLDEALSLLNERAGDRYLFSGLATDTRSTESSKKILDGDGTRAGLKQVIAERLMADQGADGRGRLDAPAVTGSVVTLAEDGDHPFGFKLTNVTTDFGAAVTPDPGPPVSFEVDLDGVAVPEGGRVQIRLALPGGSEVDIELLATNENPPPNGAFLIGADADETAQNLAGAIDDRIQQAARVELVAASAIQAGENFFAIDADNPPQRIDGPPFDTATALRDATPADTVYWYTGEAGAGNPRATSIARVDETVTVSYGARANEDGLRQIVQTAAVFSVLSFDANDPDARDRYFAVVSRMGSALDQPDGVKHVQAIQTELAGAKLSAGSAKQRLDDRAPMLHAIIDEIENVMPEEVGAKMLAMNLRLQATLQTTAMLSRFTLLNYM